jgi:hypothetical protein
VDDLAWGVYEIIASKEFSVLSGDPFATGLGCWYAVDENSRPLSTKLLSVGPMSTYTQREECIVIFAYYDNTHVVFRDMDTDNIIWEGDLDSAGYHYRREDSHLPIVFSVEATKPVSVMSAGGVNGMYVPAFNGTFTGRDFMTYQHYWETPPPLNRVLAQDIQIVPWEDNTTVTFTNLDNPADTIWHVVCQKRGELKGKRMLSDFMTKTGYPVYIHSDKDISVSQTVWYSYGIHTIAAYLARGIDREGLGLGREFYLPIEASLIGSQSKLHAFAFEDNTDIKVTRIPRDGGNETLIYEGTLNRGNFYRYTCPIGDADAHAIYHVVASEPVATVGSCMDNRGSDFMPLWFAIHPDVAAYPSPQFRETECLISTSLTDNGAYEVDVENNGNLWDVINIFTENSKAPAFTTDLSDEYGDILPDADGDGNPDTDTLTRGQSFIVLADVIPADTLPFGTEDTCFFTIVSSRDTTKLDTAFLVTRILPVWIMLDPDTVSGTVYPGESVLLDVDALNTSLYREDTVNLTWVSNKDPVIWPVEMFGLDDSDGDGNPDVEPVPVDQVPAVFQVRVGAPDSALAGDSVIIELVGASVNYPYDLDPSTNRYPADTVTDTTILIVVVEPAPDILIRPDYVDSVPAGQKILYLLEVLNFGNGPDVPDITYDYRGRLEWTHDLLAKDMVSSLPDTDGDGIPDVGTVPGRTGDVPGMDSFYLEVGPPPTALSGVADTTILRATSSINDTATDIAIIETVTRGIVSLDIEPDTGTRIGPGDTAYYVLRVTNKGGAPDTVTIGSYVLPDLGWYYEFSLDGQSLQVRNDGYSLGVIDSSETIEVDLSVWPYEGLGGLEEEIDTTVTEPRVVWVRTCYTTDLELRNDSVFVRTVFEPLLDIHNYPNPFSGSTTFAFSIPRAGHVTLRIYNRAGEHIRTLIDEDYPEGGLFEEYWDDSGHRPSPGVYIYSLQWQEQDAGGLFKTQKVVKKALMQP